MFFQNDVLYDYPMILCSGESPHDLALLRMSTPFNYTSAIAAVALPSQNVTHTGNATVTGWGSTSLTENPIMPNILQMATVPIINNTACYSALFNLVGANPLNETYNICTGSPSALGVGFCAVSVQGIYLNRHNLKLLTVVKYFQFLYPQFFKFNNISCVDEII